MKVQLSQNPVILFCLFTLFFSCKKDSDNTNPNNTNPDLATVNTDKIEDITFNSARITSTVSKEGRSAVTGMGIAWGKSPNPTVAGGNFLPSTGFGLGTYSLTIPNLELGTTYYVRSYATNAVGTAYSEQKTFNTLGAKAPSLSTLAVTNITDLSATGGGNISEEGSSAIVKRGLVWSTSPNPNLSSPGKAEASTAGTGNFTVELSNLSPGTQYYVKAFATNGQETNYGNEITFTTPARLVDIDGNEYPTVQIGTQTWMKTNLKTTRYRDGSSIPTGLSDSQWQSTTSGAYAIYGNNAANDATYGKLYNWYAVADPRGLCPAGWHVPTDAEWKTLETQLGMPASELDQTGWRGGTQNVGGKLKAVSSLWLSPNTGATDESGFSGLPGGFRNNIGYYYNIGDYGYWWSSSETSSTNAWNRSLISYFGNSNRDISDKPSGFSVRCLRD